MQDNVLIHQNNILQTVSNRSYKCAVLRNVQDIINSSVKSKAQCDFKETVILRETWRIHINVPAWCPVAASNEILPCQPLPPLPPVIVTVSLITIMILLILIFAKFASMNSEKRGGTNATIIWGKGSISSQKWMQLKVYIFVPRGNPAPWFLEKRGQCCQNILIATCPSYTAGF